MKCPFRQSYYKTLPALHKREEIFLRDAVESTPIVFHDELYIVQFNRGTQGSQGKAWDIFKVATKEKVASGDWPYGLGCALVEGDRIYLFGSTDWSKKNLVAMTYLDAKFHMGPTITVLEAVENQKIFNTSVAKDPAGYVMAYEVAEPNMVNFSIRFLRSPDLQHWEKLGTVFHPDIYAACPTIRYHNGWYYILYLRHEQKRYVMFIARTNDFEHFDDFTSNQKYPSKVQVLAPEGCPYEGLNNSDVDLVEYHGTTLLVYADGDQQTWGHLRTAVYLGYMAQFFAEFWPESK